MKSSYGPNHKESDKMKGIHYTTDDKSRILREPFAAKFAKNHAGNFSHVFIGWKDRES